MDLNPKESLELFNQLHESILNALFEENDGEKYQNSQNKFDELVDLADRSNVSLFPLQWKFLSLKLVAKYHDESIDLKRIIELYPTMMEFRKTVFELLSPKKLKKKKLKIKKSLLMKYMIS